MPISPFPIGFSALAIKIQENTICSVGEGRLCRRLSAVKVFFPGENCISVNKLQYKHEFLY